jgi:hypothetical protein
MRLLERSTAPFQTRRLADPPPHSCSCRRKAVAAPIATEPRILANAPTGALTLDRDCYAHTII